MAQLPYYCAFQIYGQLQNFSLSATLKFIPSKEKKENYFIHRFQPRSFLSLKSNLAYGITI